LQITPNPVIIEPKVVETNMVENEGDRRDKGEEFAHHLLKAVQDLSKSIEN